MEKKNLKKLTKGQLIKLLLKKVNNHQDLLDNDPFKDEVTQEPTPPPRTGKWESVSRKSVNDDLILPPPEQFQDGYKPIPKPRTDRPLKIQNTRRPLKPTRKPPPVPQVEEHIWAEPKPIPMKREPKKEVINNNQRPKVPPRIGKWANPIPIPQPRTGKWTVKKPIPAPRIKELKRALKNHAKSYEISV